MSPRVFHPNESDSKPNNGPLKLIYIYIYVWCIIIRVAVEQAQFDNAFTNESPSFEVIITVYKVLS